MATLSELQADREKLQRLLRTGVREWSIGDKSTTYAGTRELRERLSEVERQIAALQGTGPLKEVRINTSKGV